MRSFILLCIAVVRVFGDSIPAVDEYFLDDYSILNVQTLTRSVNRPVKYSGNPVFGSNTWTWDRDMNYLTADRASGLTRLWYVAVETNGGEARFCYAESTDGLVFTRPNLGLISYGGNTTNNILMAAHTVAFGVFAGATNSLPYVGMGSIKAASPSTLGIHVFTGTTATNWTLGQTLFDTGIDPNYREGVNILQREDGRFWLYYTAQGLVDRRQRGVYLSNTTNVAGTWVDLGVVIDSQSRDFQHYTMAVRKLGGTYISFISTYVRTNETMAPALWVSRDGLAWTLKDLRWLPLGAGGAWDDALILCGQTLVEMSNEWWVYYNGSPLDHAASLPRGVMVGIAKMPRGRLGQISGTGHFVTQVLSIPSGKKLYVNYNGAMSVALCSSNAVEIPNYGSANCIALASDEYDKEVTWGGNSLLNNQTVQLKFNLTNATLYNYRFN